MVMERVFTELERGEISFFYRPRVEHDDPRSLKDIQRLLVVLSPEDGGRHRLVTIGRKTLPDPRRRERFWGFVDLVRVDGRVVIKALGEQTYSTVTRGVRHLPAARIAGYGHYVIAAHDGHTHLAWRLRLPQDALLSELRMRSEGNWIVTVANPDPTVWRSDDQQELFAPAGEVHITISTPLPRTIMERFRDRKYLQLETPELLDYEGVELVLIATAESADLAALSSARVISA